MFTEIHLSQFSNAGTQNVNGIGVDGANYPYTLLATALDHHITRVLLRRGAVPEPQRFQVARGADGTLPYHSWMVERGDESWATLPPDDARLAHLQTLLTGFSASPTDLRLTRPLSAHEHIYGLGERTGPLDKRGQAFPIWNVDPPQHHTDATTTMYTSIPFYLSLDASSGQASGLLVDYAGRVEFDLGKTRFDQMRLSVEADLLVVYFFAGPTPANVLSQESASLPLHGKTIEGHVLHQAGGANPTGEDGPPIEHRHFHNAYGLQMARATYEGLRRLRPDERAFVLTRAGTAGIQRYAAVWTGDNTSRWEYIAQAIPMCLNLSLSGVLLVGMDIGGFWSDGNGQLLARFAQLGALLPFCRNHSAKWSIPQEPWAFGEPFESAYRAAIELRYRCLPYLYTLCVESARSGEPIIRPLFYHYPQDEQARQVENQFLLGETLLSAPICEKDATSREVYLPAGDWFDYWSEREYHGGQVYNIAAPLESWPLFVRANSIFPQGPLMQHTAERAIDPLTIHCYMRVHGEARYTLYEDDGMTMAHARGICAETLISCRSGTDNAQVEIEERCAQYRPQRTEYEIIVHLNGRTLTTRAAAGQGRIVVNPC